MLNTLSTQAKYASFINGPKMEKSVYLRILHTGLEQKYASILVSFIMLLFKKIL